MLIVMKNIMYKSNLKVILTIIFFDFNCNFIFAQNKEYDTTVDSLTFVNRKSLNNLNTEVFEKKNIY
jgi:hypothetical protein